MRLHVEFFKTWRSFIRGAVAHLLTPPAARADRTGWAAIQLQQPEHLANLIFVYRQHDSASEQRFRLRGLRPDLEYRLADEEGRVVGACGGARLMDDGWTVRLPAPNSAEVLVLTPA